jgi:hypothetical protein
LNYYFLPQIPSLKTTVTLANFPPITSSSWNSQSVYVHATFSTGANWKVFFIQELSSRNTISLGVEDLPEQPPKESTVFFFMYPERLPERMDLLPIDHFMESDPNWRSNIQLSSKTTSVSYQGEYPGFMLNVSKGSLLIFNPLIQSLPGVITKLIVVVLLRAPEIKMGRLFVVRQISGKIEKESEITTNICNLIDLSGLENDPKDPLCLYSPDMTGIPIFFSHDPSYRLMSLEHSYPPHEFTVFGDNAKRISLIREVKTHWINSFEKNVSS